MARRPRVFAPGLLYHVIGRGNQRQTTFLRQADYQAYLERMATYRRKHGVVVWAYCLMPNHVHLLVETTGPPLAKFMQGVQQSYTQYFNRTHEKVGHVFQGRYQAIVCEKERYLVALIRYIHLNPVRAKLVTSPEQYAYSGHGAYLTGQATAVVDPTPGLAVFGGGQAYRQFVQEGRGEGHQADYYAVEDQRFLGTERFVTQLRAQEAEEPPSRPTRSVTSAVKAVAAALRVDPATLKSADRSWTVSRQRTLVAYVLVRRKGYGVGEVAAQLGRDVTTMSVLLSRFADRVQREPWIRKTVEQAAKTV
ncbi:MAG: transposase [Gammaproteobacteria bacterium]